RLREIVLTGLLALPTAVLAMVIDAGRLGLYLQMLCSGLILLTSGRRFFRSGWQAMKNRSPNMDVLVALGVGTSWGYSALMVVQPHLAHDGMAHFEGAALLVFFILVGKGLESWARRLASGELRRLVDLQQRDVRVCDDGVEHLVALDAVKIGQQVRVLPGERFPTDAIVVEGASAADESLLTGESLPVEKATGSVVLSGSVNLQAPLRVKVTRDGAESTLQTLIRAVRRAQADKPPIQRFADRAAEWFVPVIIGLSCLTALGWWLAGAPVSLAIMHAVTVLVVACPCALGLATPTAVVVACGMAMRHGLLVRRPSALETLAQVRYLLLDKTGTITQGRPQVQVFHACDEALTCEERGVVAALAGSSNHPLSTTIRAWATETSLSSVPLTEVSEQRGLGLAARDSEGMW
ncbi:MAG TPA: HAD-IC family P-type ATPase, partial [Candidatus Ozemobacteraceae bacterium]|nr:HAD-IC family P-type ATPase [Candidatus Ozemobacteraceae bacterium]